VLGMVLLQRTTSRGDLASLKVQRFKALEGRSQGAPNEHLEPMTEHLHLRLSDAAPARVEATHPGARGL